MSICITGNSPLSAGTKGQSVCWRRLEDGLARVRE